MLRIRFILQENEKPPESIISLPATFIPFSLSRGTFCPCLQSLYCPLSGYCPLEAASPSEELGLQLITEMPHSQNRQGHFTFKDF